MEGISKQRESIEEEKKNQILKNIEKAEKRTLWLEKLANEDRERKKEQEAA